MSFQSVFELIFVVAVNNLFLHLHGKGKNYKEEIMKNTIERRKQVRYKTVDGVYLLFNSADVEMAQIRDISTKGVSFDQPNCNDWESKKFNVTIKIPAEGLRMKDLPFKKIFQITKKEAKYKCCIRFGNLSPLQERQMKYVISHYTIS